MNYREQGWKAVVFILLVGWLLNGCAQISMQDQGPQDGVCTLPSGMEPYSLEALEYMQKCQAINKR